ncbi:thermonuclease family protein [Cyanobium sp. CH-040]|nr:thermonuclease family protein [Cyanobium sp. CH-040]
MERRWLLPLVGLACLLLLPTVVVGYGSAGRVVSIGDGDTIRVRQQDRAITVRLACIDAPEMAQQPHGQRARDYLRMRLPIGSTVRLDVNTTDRYGRTVAEVIGEINIGLALVEDGQAFAYRQYLSGCNAREYLDAEVRASRRRAGVWQVNGGITRPWDFRRSPRGRNIPDGTTPGGRRYTCRQIGSSARAQQLLRQGHTYLDGDGDGEACESLPR